MQDCRQAIGAKANQIGNRFESGLSTRLQTINPDPDADWLATVDHFVRPEKFPYDPDNAGRE